MEDILSAALCEAGLEEFILPSPVPSTSGSVHEETTSSEPGTSFDGNGTNDTLQNDHTDTSCSQAAYEDDGTSRSSAGEPQRATETPEVVIDGSGMEVAEEVIVDGTVMEPLSLDITTMNGVRDQMSSNSSPARFRVSTSLGRSSTASPASTGSASSSTATFVNRRPIIRAQDGERLIQRQGDRPIVYLQNTPNGGQPIRRVVERGTPVQYRVVRGSPLSRQFGPRGGGTPVQSVVHRGNGEKMIVRPGTQLLRRVVDSTGRERFVPVTRTTMTPDGRIVTTKATPIRGRGGAVIVRQQQPTTSTTPTMIRHTGSSPQLSRIQSNQRIVAGLDQNQLPHRQVVSSVNRPLISRVGRGGKIVFNGGQRVVRNDDDHQPQNLLVATNQHPGSAPISPAFRESPAEFSQRFINARVPGMSPRGPPQFPEAVRPTLGSGIQRQSAPGYHSEYLPPSASSHLGMHPRMKLAPGPATLKSLFANKQQLQQQVPLNAVAAAMQAKSQKAKDEMRMAYQMGTDDEVKRQRNELDEEEENLGYAETYAEYTPAKLRSGIAHPDSVVESASLSSILPPDVRYHLSIPEYLIDMGSISALQLEAVIYACQMHERRMPSGERYGYLIGDGAGVGKGRTVACIIFENYLQGRKRAVWLSVSSDLKYDAERDLRDVGAPNIKVHALNKMKYAKISGKENCNVKKGVIFSTYTSLIGECRGAKSRKYRSRIKQLIQWFGVDYDGVIILDECHRAKNLCPTTGAKPTKTGRMVLELQKALPNARVVYASATGATEPRNMAYMTRLGLWGEGQSFPEFGSFINAVERRGVGAMEIVAMDMKQRGLYLARQLSFRGASFSVQEVQLAPEFVKIYDDSVKLWMECRRQFQYVMDKLDEEDRSPAKHVWGQFWACHQRFFKYLCIAAKVGECVRLSREAIKAKKCVVIGLQSTGESATLETLGDMGGELNEFVSTAKAVLYSLIDKHFPTDCGSNSGFFGGGSRDMFRDFDDFEKPAKRRKLTGGSMAFDSGGTWSVTTGMSGTVGAPSSSSAKDCDDANSTTSESSDESDGSGSKPWDSDREEAEGARTLDDAEEDEWVKALLAEAESSSGSDDEDEMTTAAAGSDKDEETADDFNPFMCDFSSDPWAKKQQIVDEVAVAEKREAKKRKREEAEAKIKEQERKREEKQKKRMRRKMQHQEREKKRRMESAQKSGSANDFMSSSRICGSDEQFFNPMLIKTELLAAVERLGPQLPANTLDQLIDELGGPEYVAEMTGRRGHIVTTESGAVQYERRNANADVSLELINMEEKEKFMKGEKLVAIISEAASSGISLQSDRRAVNQRRRVHLTLELPWSADKAIQQFGRTHRSNQVTAPEYVFLISELAGEKRFASVVAKRLESLGALTHGDRRASESRDLSQFNMDNKYGRAALDFLLKTIIGVVQPPIAPPKDYTAGDFLEDMKVYMEGVGLLARHRNQWTIERESATIPKFLNRILGLPVHAQNSLFQYFTEIVAELIKQAKHDGTYDSGIMDLGTGGDQVRKQETRSFVKIVENERLYIHINKIGVERGVSWDDAHALWKEHNTEEDGFYVTQPSANSNSNVKKVAALVYAVGKLRLDNGARLFAITRPSTGRSPKLLTMAELSKRFTKVTPEEAMPIWTDQFDGSSKMCQHQYVYGKCKMEINGTYCEVGRRTRTYFVLSGSVLSVWPIVEHVLSSTDGRSSRMQVIRVRTEEDQKIVGLLVLPNQVRNLIEQLEVHCERSFVKDETK